MCVCVFREDLEQCRKELSKERAKVVLKSDELEREKNTRVDNSERWKSSEQELRVVSNNGMSIVSCLSLQKMLVFKFPAPSPPEAN